MNFFFDRNTPIRIARMLAVYEAVHTVRHHDDDSRFVPTTPDVEWIVALGKDESPWTVISGDKKILRDKVERATLLGAGLKFFCLHKRWSGMDFHERAWKFVRLWPKIVEQALNSRHQVFEIAAGSALNVFPID